MLAFVRNWTPAEYQALRYAPEMLDQNVAFQLWGRTTELLHDCPEARLVWKRSRSERAGESMICLVTGEYGPVARTHPTIKNLALPGQPIPRLIAIDGDNDAFSSYRKERGANAPVSEWATHAYATALNALLAARTANDSAAKQPRRSNRLQIGDVTLVFWAEAEGGANPAGRMERAEMLLSLALERSPTDEEETINLLNMLRDMKVGRTLTEVDPQLHHNMRFHVLGLSPNSARISVRFYVRQALGILTENLVRHWRDLHIEPSDWKHPPAIRFLLRETAAQADTANISPRLGGELARAILTGGRYPRSLQLLTIMRIRTDGRINGLRAAILKACLVRGRRLRTDDCRVSEQEDAYVVLDRSNMDPAYRLGRLFCILEKAQWAALGQTNASIRDKFYASASSNPARVFPLLLRGTQHHIASIRREKIGLAHWFDDQIAEVMNGLANRDPFPTTLNLDDQALFAVGYYHQRNAAQSERRDMEDIARAEPNQEP